MQNAENVHARHTVVHLYYSVLCVGVGPPLSIEHTRMLLALRINILAKGYRLVQPYGRSPDTTLQFRAAATTLLI